VFGAINLVVSKKPRRSTFIQSMSIAYLAITTLLAAIVMFSGIGKIRRDPHIVQVIHEVIGGQIFHRNSRGRTDVCQPRTRCLLICESCKARRERLRRSMSDAHHDRSRQRIDGPLKERSAGLRWTEITPLP
jgi:hypothetical protein